jgi:hypothetical protein
MFFIMPALRVAGLIFTPLNIYPVKSSFISPGPKDYLTGAYPACWSEAEIPS